MSVHIPFARIWKPDSDSLYENRCRPERSIPKTPQRSPATMISPLMFSVIKVGQQFSIWPMILGWFRDWSFSVILYLFIMHVFYRSSTSLWLNLQSKVNSKHNVHGRKSLTIWLIDFLNFYLLITFELSHFYRSKLDFFL